MLLLAWCQEEPLKWALCHHAILPDHKIACENVINHDTFQVGRSVMIWRLVVGYSTISNVHNICAPFEWWYFALHPFWSCSIIMNFACWVCAFVAYQASSEKGHGSSPEQASNMVLLYQKCLCKCQNHWFIFSTRSSLLLGPLTV